MKAILVTWYLLAGEPHVSAEAIQIMSVDDCEDLAESLNTGPLHANGQIDMMLGSAVVKSGATCSLLSEGRAADFGLKFID